MTPEYQYEPLEGILVRTPLLPTSLLDSQNSSTLADALQLAAIAVSSSSLVKRLKQSVESPKALSAQRRYQKRMSHRATPYGLLAGVSWAKFGAQTTLCRNDASITTQSRPDMEWLSTCVAELEKDREVKPFLGLMTNPEVLIIGGNIWLERFVFPKSVDSKETISMNASKVVLYALHLCNDGGITLGGLCERLCSEFGGSEEDAKNFVEHLLESNLLFSELRFALNDWSSLLIKLSTLRFSKLAVETHQRLKLALSELEQWDCLTTKTAESFISLSENLKQLAPKGMKDVIQVDAMFDLSGDVVSRQISSELNRALEIVLRLGTNQFDSTINSYLELFNTKYQVGREISLLELLSPRFGLGSPYLRTDQLTAKPIVSRAKRDEALMQLVTDAMASDSSTIELTDKDVKNLEMWSPTIKDAPLTVEMHAGIVANSRSAIDEGDFKLLLMPYTGAIGAGRTQGRFTSLLGTRAIEHLAQIALIEKRESESLKVDISFWPETPRSSNVAIAPATRQYCINVNCNAPSGTLSIPLSEIFIGVEHGRFYAVWMRTRQRITAMSSNLLTYQAMPDSIRFLLDIATYGQPKPARFDCGYASDLIFFPRVTYGKVILRAATWKLSELKAFISSPMGAGDFVELIARWKQQRQVPRKVYLSNGQQDDNLIYLDLEQNIDVELLKETISKQEYSDPVLHEYIPIDTWNSNENGSYATEIVVGFVRKSLGSNEEQHPEIEPIRRHEILATPDYLKPPGSDWIYLQLDCSNQLQEYASVQASQLANQLLTQEAIDRWFFVRYRDPNPQLRIRFRANSNNLYATVIPELFKWASSLVSKRIIKGFSVNTYDREIERYGGRDGMDLAEKLFTIDSSLTAGIFAIPTLRKLDRGVVAAITIRWSLNALGFDDNEQLELFKFVESEKSLLADTDYRKLKHLFFCALNDSFHVESSYRPVINQVKSFAFEYAELGKAFRTLEKQGELSQTVIEIHRSIIHMHCIRLLGVNRDMELKALTLYHRSLKSYLKRLEYSKTN